MIGGRIYISRERMLEDLERLGVREGGTIIVHSSYKAIGDVEGGPDTVVRALKEKVGGRGIVAMPTFTFGRYTPFETRISPSETGAISEVFRRSEGVARSEHPTHAMALWGLGARQFAEAHDHTTGLGVGSPYDLVAERPEALILQIGVSATTNSYIHVCEDRLRLPYVEDVYWHGLKRMYEVRREDGSRYKRDNSRIPGCSQGFGVVDKKLEEIGRMRREWFGAATTQALTPADILEAVRLLVEDKPDALLCGNASCGFCPRARESLRRHGYLP